MVGRNPYRIIIYHIHRHLSSRLAYRIRREEKKRENLEDTNEHILNPRLYKSDDTIKHDYHTDISRVDTVNNFHIVAFFKGLGFLEREYSIDYRFKKVKRLMKFF
jgi:hypothetical protein